MTPKIVAIHFSDDGKKVVLVIQIERGKRGIPHSLTITEYQTLSSPKIYTELDDELFEQIKEYDSYHKCMDSALRLLSYGDQSQKKLSLKLLRRGFKKEQIEKVIAQMLNLHYLDDERTLKNLLLHHARKGWGRKRVISQLILEGYKTQQIEPVLQTLEETGQIDFEENKRKFIQTLKEKGYPPEKIRMKLYQSGF